MAVLKSRSTRRQKIIGYIVLSLVAFTTLFPFYAMMVMGTHKNSELFTKINLWFGDQFVENFKMLVDAGYFRYFLNSLIIAIPNTLLTLLSCSMGGYALAKFRFRGRKFFVNFVFITLMLPGSLGTIAWVWEMKQFGWINTYWPFIIPAMGNTYGVFWFLQFSTSNVPTEIMESARVDGANEFQIYWKIILPLLIPACISLGLLQFVGTWNNYMGPFLILKKQELYTVPIGIATLGSMFRVEYSTRILGMTIASLPLIILFACTSKHFIMGVTGGSVKG